MNKEKIILIGGGGHCKSCIDVIEQENKFQIAGIVDLKEKIGTKILGYEIIASDEDITKLVKDYSYYFITVGHIKSVDLRFNLYNAVSKFHVKFPVILSPLAYVSEHAKINEGTIIMHYAFVNASAIIGCNCIINTRAIIEHDVVIGDFCHISTGAIVNGGVTIGERTFFGSGAVSKQYINIPANSFIKANRLISQ
jgi:sugar O-acyltransferase (sialic acid O-acetyltransferase NeuD family)